MKENIVTFLRRGMIACGLGPVVLAVIYLILHKHGVMQTITINQACTGILSLAALAFVVGGSGIVYQIEQLSIMIAALIHGGILYASYLVVYLVNGWLIFSTAPIMVFTVIFVAGYLIIWAVIYLTTKSRTDKVNEKLKQTQQRVKDI